MPPVRFARGVLSRGGSIRQPRTPCTTPCDVQTVPRRVRNGDVRAHALERRPLRLNALPSAALAVDGALSRSHACTATPARRPTRPAHRRGGTQGYSIGYGVLKGTRLHSHSGGLARRGLLQPCTYALACAARKHSPRARPTVCARELTAQRCDRSDSFRCHYCGILGHVSANCTSKPASKRQLHAPWRRADQVYAHAPAHFRRALRVHGKGYGLVALAGTGCIAAHSGLSTVCDNQHWTVQHASDCLQRLQRNGNAGVQCSTRRATCNMQRTTCNMQRATLRFAP